MGKKRRDLNENIGDVEEQSGAISSQKDEKTQLELAATICGGIASSIDSMQLEDKYIINRAWRLAGLLIEKNGVENNLRKTGNDADM